MAQIVGTTIPSNYEIINGTVKPATVAQPVTVKPATTYKPLDANQKLYLTNKITDGTSGEAKWAYDQLVNVYGMPKTQADYIIPKAAKDAGYGAPVIANGSGIATAIGNNQITGVNGGDIYKPLPGITPGPSVPWSPTAPTTPTAPAPGNSGGSGGGYTAPTTGGGGSPAPAPSPTIAGTAPPAVTDYLYMDRPIGGMPKGPEYETGDWMASNFNIIHDFAKMLGLKQDAINTQYANLDNEWGRTKDQYYDLMGGNADMVLGMLQQGDRMAARTGTASGTNAANQLSALLGLSEDASVGATDLAQQRADLVSEREAALAKATSDTLSEHNDLGVNLGTLANSKYGHENNAYAALLATLGGIDASLIGERMNNAQIIANKDLEQMRTAATIAAAKAGGSSYGGGSSGTGTATSNVENQMAGLFTLHSMTDDPAQKAAIVGQFAKLMGVSLPEAEAILKTGGIKGAVNNLTNGGQGTQVDLFKNVSSGSNVDLWKNSPAVNGYK